MVVLLGLMVYGTLHQLWRRIDCLMGLPLLGVTPGLPRLSVRRFITISTVTTFQHLLVHCLWTRPLDVGYSFRLVWTQRHFILRVTAHFPPCSQGEVGVRCDIEYNHDFIAQNIQVIPLVDESR